MRYQDFRIVEGMLGKPTDDKYIPAVNQILKDPNAKLPIGKSGERGELIPLPGQQVSTRKDKIVGYIVQNKSQELSSAYVKNLEQKNSAEIQLELKKMIPLNLITLKDANIPNVSELAKRELETRKTSVLVSTLFKSDEIKLAAGGAVSDKEKYAIKPSDIFIDERFPAPRVFDEVINNPKLKEQEIGQVIIEMAKEIKDGNDAQFKNINPEFKSAIRDYAGEYLGVLSLIGDTANFPTRKQWLEHLGVSDINSIFINFPQQSNFALGDSIGSFENAETGNMILISSKGGKMGAPPSLNSLKIPENLLNSNRYAAEVAFVETMQGASAVQQPFVGINKLFEFAPESINETIRSILPLSNQDIAELESFMDRGYNKNDWQQLPEKYHPLIKLINKSFARFADTSTPGGLIHYIMTKDIINAVNDRNAMPEFESMAREILQKNFIQIFARPKGTVLGFDILWPNVEMATGNVKLYSKASANDPKKAKMSFSVTD
jgi:hypothetical protein